MSVIKYIAIIFVFANTICAFSFDKKVQTSNSLFYTSHYDIPYILGYSLATYSLIEGIDNNSANRFHKASSKAIESLVINQILTQAIKSATGRKRPRHSDDPNQWGNYKHESFPSGHVSSTTSIIVPYILEYKDDYPLVYLLALLPIHQALGRINANAHWQSDVLAGIFLGSAIAILRNSKKDNLLLSLSKDKKFIGFRIML